MKKVLCIKNKENDPRYHTSLTIGKWYEVLHEDSLLIMVINDIGLDMFYGKNLFIDTKEIRKQKLEQLKKC